MVVVVLAAVGAATLLEMSRSRWRAGINQLQPHTDIRRRHHRASSSRILTTAKMVVTQWRLLTEVVVML